MTMKTLLRLYKITTHLEEVRLIRYRIAVCYSSYENYQHSKLTKLVMRIATFYSFEPKFSSHCKFRQFMITKTCLKETISTTRNAFLGIQSHSYKQLWVFQRRSWNSILFIIYYSYYREQRLFGRVTKLSDRKTLRSEPVRYNSISDVIMMFKKSI